MALVFHKKGLAAEVSLAFCIAYLITNVSVTKKWYYLYSPFQPYTLI